MADWLEDPDALADQYDDAENLNDRIALHERYSTAEREFRAWQFDQFDCPDDARVLGVGVGPAELWSANRDRVPDDWDVVLTDFSPGMVGEARANLDAGGTETGEAAGNPAETTPGFAFGTADAAALPFADDAFDAVTAHHMLYHVPDREAAFAEFRRVLRPDGRLHATTNGEDNVRVVYDVLEAVTGERPGRATGFRLENGREQLATAFDRVELRRYDDALDVTDPDALVRYAVSRDDVEESLAPELRGAFADRFEDGSLRIDKQVGTFVAGSA